MATSLNRPNRIEYTHSLDEFIGMGGSITKYDYIQFTLREKVDGTEYIVHNILDDYITDLKDNSVWVTLTDEQVQEYKFNPKKLSYKLYETTLFHHIILKINNLCSTHDFTLTNKRIRLLRPDTIKTILSEVYTAEKNSIYTYNNTHNNITN
jgi:hypothetical protein